MQSGLAICYLRAERQMTAAEWS